MGCTRLRILVVATLLALAGPDFAGADGIMLDACGAAAGHHHVGVRCATSEDRGDR